MYKKLMRLFPGVLLISALTFNTFAAAKEKTLYDKLGGKKAIVAVVDQFVNNVGGDSRINGYFKATVADPKRLASFKGKLVDQICEAAGGPCKYKGKDMKAAHKGMGVDSAALAEGLRVHGHRMVKLVESADDLASSLRDIAADGDMILCLGAGDITKWAAGLADGIAKARKSKK